MALVVAVVPARPSAIVERVLCFRKGGRGRVRIDQAVVAFPIVIGTGVLMGLIGEVLMAFDPDAASQEAATAASATGRPIVGPEGGYPISSGGTNVPAKIRRTLIEGSGQVTRVVDIAFVLDADRIIVLGAYVPCHIGFQDQLGDLAVGGSDRVVEGDVRIAILGPGDGPGIRPLHRMDGHVGDRGPVPGGIIAGRSRVPYGRRIVGASEFPFLKSGPVRSLDLPFLDLDEIAFEELVVRRPEDAVERDPIIRKPVSLLECPIVQMLINVVKPGAHGELLAAVVGELGEECEDRHLIFQCLAADAERIHGGRVSFRISEDMFPRLLRDRG